MVSGSAVEFHVVKAKVDARRVVGIRQLGAPKAATDAAAPQATRELSSDVAEVRAACTGAVAGTSSEQSANNCRRPTQLPAVQAVNRRPSAPERLLGFMDAASQEGQGTDAAAPAPEASAAQLDARRAASLDLPRGAFSLAGTPAPPPQSPVSAPAVADTDLHQWELVWSDQAAGSRRLRRLAFTAAIQGAAYVRDMLAAALAASAPREEEDDLSGDAGSEARGTQDAAGERDEFDGLDDEDELPEPVDTHVDLAPGPLPALPPGGLLPGGVLTEHHIRCLATAFPGRTRLARWDLVYNSRTDGISLRSLLRAGAHRAPSLLAVKDASGGVFGAFVCEPWRVGTRYYGTGESFVFTCVPAAGAQPVAVAGSVDPAEPLTGVRIFKWSGRNAYFQLGQADALAVGGGGAYALKMDDDLAQGLSGECDTFASPCLATAPEFDILHVELWAFDAL